MGEIFSSEIFSENLLLGLNAVWKVIEPWVFGSLGVYVLCEFFKSGVLSLACSVIRDFFILAGDTGRDARKKSRLFKKWFNIGDELIEIHSWSEKKD